MLQLGEVITGQLLIPLQMAPMELIPCTGSILRLAADPAWTLKPSPRWTVPDQARPVPAAGGIPLSHESFSGLIFANRCTPEEHKPPTPPLLLSSCGF